MFKCFIEKDLNLDLVPICVCLFPVLSRTGISNNRKQSETIRKQNRI